MRLLREIWDKPFARATLVFGLLVAPWPGLPRLYTGALAAGVGVVLGNSGGPAELEFRGAPPGSSSWEIRVRVTASETGQFLDTALDARRTGYLPAAVLVALAFASRLPRKCKGVAVSLGLALLQSLVLLPVLSFFSGRLPIVAFDLSPLSRVMVDVLYRSLVAPLGMAFALPVLLWVILSWLFAPSHRGPREGPVGPSVGAPAPAGPVRPPLTRSKSRKRRERRR